MMRKQFEKIFKKKNQNIEQNEQIGVHDLRISSRVISGLVMPSFFSVKNFFSMRKPDTETKQFRQNKN